MAKMDTRALYKRVLGEAPMGQAEFFDYYNDCVRTLSARYGSRYVAEEGSSLRPVDSLDAQSGVRDIYFTPIAEGIIAKKTGDRERRADSIAGAEESFRTVWRETVARKRMKGDRW